MNKPTQFTPGPLKAVQIFIENSPCTWAVQRKNIREQWGKPSIATYIDNEADARLFAAAPAMYEALQDAFVALDGYRQEWEDNNPGKEYNPFRLMHLARIKAALAQAEGR